MENNKNQYFEVDAVSSSRIGCINGNEGGSPKKYLEFGQDKDKKESISLERGSLVHLWHEHQEDFIVSEVEKPTEMMCLWVEKVLSHIDGLRQITPDISEGQIQGSILTVKEQLGVYKSTKDVTKILEKFKEGQPYFDFLCKADGKQILTLATKNIVENCIKSIREHSVANDLLFKQNTFNNIKYFKEIEIYWKQLVKKYDGSYTYKEKSNETFEVELDCKAKLDNVEIDFDKKIIKLKDLKTTAFPISQFICYQVLDVSIEFGLEELKYVNKVGSFFKFRYYRQLAFYKLALKNWLLQNVENVNLSEWKVECYVVAVETTNNFACGVFRIPEEYTRIGTTEYKELLELIAWHTYTGKWDKTKLEHENGGYLL